MTDAEPTDTDSAHAHIGIVCALPMELAAFLERCDRARKIRGKDFVFRGGRYEGIRVAVVESGVGFARARRATQALIDAYSPPWLLSCGFSGALRPEMKIGEIVMANAVTDTHGHRLTVDVHMPADPQKGLHVGCVVSSDEIVRTVEEKRSLAEEYDAVAVDLESLAVAQICRDTKTRFLAVRAISDDMSVDLPPEILSVLGATSSMRLGAALGAAWKRPGSIKDMWQLREAAQRAAAQLANFLDGVVRQLYDNMQ